MPSRTYQRIMSLGWGLAVASGFAVAQTTQPAPTTAPADPAVQARATELLERALKNYRAAKSYTDRISSRAEIAAKGRAGEDAGQVNEFATALRFSRPNRLALTTDDVALHSDGKTFWAYVEDLEQYTEKPAPERFDFTALLESSLDMGPPHPVLYVLLAENKPFAELFPMVKGFTAVEPEERDGRPGTRIRALVDAEQTMLELPGVVPISIWIHDKTGLVEQLELDATVALRTQFGLDKEPKSGEEDEMEDAFRPFNQIDRAAVTLTFHDVRIDVDIPAGEFAFQPPTSATKVDEFDFSRGPDPNDLLGQHAPPFAGDALDGKPIALEDLRGRVVLLDFWATWCGPCVAAMPFIQRIAEKYADQPFSVVGINQDSAGEEMAGRVKRFLEERKVTFRHFRDPDGKLGRQYKVSGIPCSFLLDKEGRIQAVHLGFSPSLEQDLSAKIDKLLKGETLVEPKKEDEQPQP